MAACSALARSLGYIKQTATRFSSLFLFGVLVFLVVLVKERHVGERGGLDVARELVNVVDRVPEPPAFVVVVASVDGVRRLVDAAVTHFSTESELVALVGDVVEDG